MQKLHQPATCGSSYRGLIDFRSRGLKSPSQPTRFASGDICAIVARATYIRGGRSLFAAMLGVNSRGDVFFQEKSSALRCLAEPGRAYRFKKLARCPAQFARVSSFFSKFLDFFTLEKLNANSFV